MYPVAGDGVVTQGPLTLVAKSTVGLATLVLFMFQLFVLFVTAALALVIPVDVPSSFNAADSAAASQNTCVSFLAINALPTSTAIPMAPMIATAPIAMVISTNPCSRRVFLGCTDPPFFLLISTVIVVVTS